MSKTAIMTHILHRQTGHSYAVAASGHGVPSATLTAMSTSTLRPARRYRASDTRIRCAGGNARAARPLAYAHTSFFTTQVAEELADDLIAHAPKGMGRVSTSAAGRRRSSALSSRGNISSSAASLNADTSLPAPELSRRHARALAIGGGNGSASNSLAADRPSRLLAYEYRERRADETRRPMGAASPRSRWQIQDLGGDHVIAFVAERSSEPRWERSRRCGYSSACARSATATAFC